MTRLRVTGSTESHALTRNLGDVSRLQFAVTHVPGILVRERTVARQRILCGRIAVLEDPDRNGAWWNTRRAWRRLLETQTADTTHSVMLQDDLDPCDLFVENLEAALEAVPDKAVTFFSMRYAANNDVDGNRWLTTADGINGGTAIPAGWVGEFVDWSDMAVTGGYPHDDRVLAAWIIWTGRGPVYATIPPLVQHVAAGASLQGHSNSTRVATGFRKDLPVLDWKSGGVLNASGSVGPWIKEVEAHLTPAGAAWLRERRG